MTKKNQNTIWFLFVMLMLSFGIGMSIWTVTRAVSLPVQESNNYMLKYQTADRDINKIMVLQAKFDANYKIELQNATLLTLDEELQNTNAKRVQQKPVKLSLGKNRFDYAITTKSGEVVKNAKVSFLLTRPHTQKEDQKEEKVALNGSVYTTKAIELSNKGRYTLVLKVEIDNAVGYSEIPAYLAE